MHLMQHYPSYVDARRFSSQHNNSRPYSACTTGRAPRGYSPYHPSDLNLKAMPIRVELNNNQRRAAPSRPASQIRQHDNRFFRDNMVYCQPRSEYSRELAGMRCESMNYVPRYGTGVPRPEMPLQRHVSAAIRQPYNPEYFGQAAININRHPRYPTANALKVHPAAPALPQRQPDRNNMETSIINKLYDKPNSKPASMRNIDVKMTQSIIEGPAMRRR